MRFVSLVVCDSQEPHFYCSEEEFMRRDAFLEMLDVYLHATGDVDPTDSAQYTLSAMADAGNGNAAEALLRYLIGIRGCAQVFEHDVTVPTQKLSPRPTVRVEIGPHGQPQVVEESFAVDLEDL